MILKRNFFTFLEILIVMTVLALVTTVIGLNLRKAIREQRFKTEVELIVDYLRLAQNLMLIMDTDVHVIFEGAEDSRHNTMRLEVDGHLNDSLLKLVAGKEKQLHDVHFIDFYDENNPHTERNKIDARFISKGSVMSKGVMRLATNEESDEIGGLERYIYFPGYPKPIRSTLEKEDDPSSQEKTLDDNQKLLQLTMQEIQTKQQLSIINPQPAP